MDRKTLTKTEYEILRSHLEHIEKILLPDVSERLKKARLSGVEFADNYEYCFCRDEQAFFYTQIDKIKELLDTAEVTDVVVFPYRK